MLVCGAASMCYVIAKDVFHLCPKAKVEKHLQRQHHISKIQNHYVINIHSSSNLNSSKQQKTK